MAAQDERGRSAGISLSYAHEDRPFVQRLAEDLRAKGVAVWVDEGEIGLGDSLLEKITDAIGRLDYLGVVLSPYSSRSEWSEQGGRDRDGRRERQPPRSSMAATSST